MATWNALTEASFEPVATSARTRGGTSSTSTRVSGCFSASATALATSGLAAPAAPSSSRSADPNDEATTAPTAAIAIRLATRAIALFTPDAIPALCSSASASTVAVSGATVIASPSAKTIRPGSRSAR